ncbi:uncharacterized protein [Antedon mediterranea]|uniref:uncharacterized protein n=1 Tax=Antedon mediterranea TaxID=105859 RepID=UPI003AF45FD9
MCIAFFLIFNYFRVDFVLEASAKPSTYCIYVVGIPNPVCPAIGAAKLKYKNSPTMDVNCTQYNTEQRDFFSTAVLKDNDTDVYTFKDTHALQPVDPALYHVDTVYYVVMGVSYYSYTSNRPEAGTTHSPFFTMNQVQFDFPDKPFVSFEPNGNVDSCRTYPGYNNTELAECNNTHCSCPLVAKVKLGQVVEFVVIDDVHIINHPMHLHGQSFRLLAQGLKNISADELIEFDKTHGLPRIPLESAVVKDTVNIISGGYVIIRWKAENPGYWFFHCHVEYHSLAGMAMIIQVGEEDEIPNPPKGFPTCGSFTPGEEEKS